MTRPTAAETLSALSILAHGEEQAHRYQDQRLRTVEHVMERLTLYVGARYDAETENRIILWSTSTLEKALAGYKLPVRLVYYADWEGHRVNLTQEAAVAVLEAGTLPPDVQARLRAEDVAAEEQRIRDRVDAALFASLNRATPSTAGDGGRPAWTPRRRSAVKLLAPLPRAEAVARMRRFYE